MKQAMMTTNVVPSTSLRPGQLTFFISTQTSRKKSRVVGHHSRIGFMLASLAGNRNSEIGNRFPDRPCLARFVPLASSLRLPIPDYRFPIPDSRPLAGVEGFEPPTYGFGDRRSTN